MTVVALGPSSGFTRRAFVLSLTLLPDALPAITTSTNHFGYSLSFLCVVCRRRVAQVFRFTLFDLSTSKRFSFLSFSTVTGLFVDTLSRSLRFLPLRGFIVPRPVCDTMRGSVCLVYVGLGPGSKPRAWAGY